jgi:hypothetical protein
MTVTIEIIGPRDEIVEMGHFISDAIGLNMDRARRPRPLLRRLIDSWKPDVLAYPMIGSEGHGAAFKYRSK